METNIEKAEKLKRIVSEWVNSFNFIQLNVVETIAREEGMDLFEFIRQDELTISDLAEYTGEDEDKISLEYENFEDHPSFDDMRSDKDGENYPMWNTLFEFKDDVSEDIIQSAINAGFGIIEGMEDFNTMLFMSGCGYSFYGAHWIPLYLSLPWNRRLREEYSGVDYSMM